MTFVPRVELALDCILDSYKDCFIIFMLQKNIASVNKANHISIMHWHIYYEAFSRYNIVCAELNPAFGLVTQLGQ